ncbi:hypothetical protein, partial [Streptomyces sp. V2]|uniref:hypothetical protein n=1 Tax=Streptomyces sp. V2 TaxID=1424099 RepID=UPI001F0C69CC
MSEWGVALIAAGSAVAGSIVTGWYARGAGIRQAEAARHAGDRQADALLESVRITIRADAEQRARAERRRVYAEFLAAAEARILTERTGRGGPEDEAQFQRALGLTVLEGPPPVAETCLLYTTKKKTQRRQRGRPSITSERLSPHRPVSDAHVAGTKQVKLHVDDPVEATLACETSVTQDTAPH